MRIAVVNLKGGTGKTMTAVHLSAGLARRGRTLLVDADPQGSTLSWSEAAVDFPCPAVGLPVRDLRRRLGTLGAGYDHVVIDTPPGNAAIVRGALLAADTVVIPMPPSLVDLDRLGPTQDLIDEAGDESDFEVRVLLTRVRKATRSAGAIRKVLDELDVKVLTAEVPLREALATSFGTDPSTNGAYGAVLEELLAARPGRSRRRAKGSTR